MKIGENGPEIVHVPLENRIASIPTERELLAQILFELQKINGEATKSAKVLRQADTLGVKIDAMQQDPLARKHTEHGAEIKPLPLEEWTLSIHDGVIAIAREYIDGKNGQRLCYKRGARLTALSHSPDDLAAFNDLEGIVFAFHWGDPTAIGKHEVSNPGE